METCTTIPELKAALWGMPRVVLVPTMGALHRGHLALIEEARRCAGEAGTVMASIFVNPQQFGPGEDYLRYPRREQDDLEQCAAAGVDLVFVPDVDEMYFPDASVKVTESRLSTYLCGLTRHGHFPAVCIVVLKLFNIVSPDIAVFGKKDYQQLAVIRRMVRDLNIEVEIVGVPTVREKDGLAVSSRNIHLSAEERAQAIVISKALFDAQSAATAGDRDAKFLAQRVEAAVSKVSLAKVEYVMAVDPDTLQPVDSIRDRAVLAVAVNMGRTRLIDNIELEPPPIEK